VDPGQLEVLVIDDGSSAPVSQIVSEAADLGPFSMKCHRQELAGLNVARNHGAAATSGDVLAFLDDDTLVSPGWAHALLAAFADLPCAGVGGRVQLKMDVPEPPWLGVYRCLLGEYELGPESRWLTDDDPVPIGANCAVRRTDFERVSGFAEGLDRRGRSLVSNGDTDFFRRIRASGGRLRYDAAAAVRHCVPTQRLTHRYMARRFFGQGMSDELQFAPDVPFSWRRRLGLARFAVGGAKLLCRDLLHGRDPTDGMYALGYWAGRSAAHRKATFSGPAG